MKNKIKSWISDNYLHTIRSRILLCTISLIIVISTIITIISYFVVSQNLRESMIQTSETKLSFLCSSIDSNINSVKGFIRSNQVSTKIRRFAMETEPTDNKIKREAHDYIMETYNSNTALSSYLIRCVIIGNSRSDIVQVVETTNSTISVSAQAIVSLPYFEMLRSNMGEVSTQILPDPFVPARSILMIPFVHSIQHPYKAGEIGYVFTEMSVKVITEPIRNYSTENDSLLYFRIGDYQYQYENDELVLCSENFEVIKDLSDLALNDDTIVQKIHTPGGQDTSILIVRPLSTQGWYVAECLDEDVLSKNIFHTFFLIAVIIIAASSAIGILLSVFLSKTVNVPIKQLQERMKRIAGGDFSRDDSTEWSHELGDIGKSINDLSENVLSLMNQKLEDERQKQDYEYRMLQSQINPHFLYNTLNSIKWMATIQNAPGIAEMTTALSRLLKDISKGTTHLVLLEHELNLLKDYYTIQQYRYGGTIALSVQIEDERLKECEILKFTLQPIVENAIFHGIEPKGSAGTITIHIYQDHDGDVHIDVTDDGVGMSPETASNLLKEETATGSSFFKEIGISNVHKRLQYEFGSKYGLSVESKLGEFTTVSILLPFRKKGEEK